MKWLAVLPSAVLAAPCFEHFLGLPCEDYPSLVTDAKPAQTTTTAAPLPDPRAMAAEMKELRREVFRSNEEFRGIINVMAKKVSQDEDKLNRVLGDLKTFRGRLPITQECGRFQTCQNCTAIPTCVWCSVEQTCTTGDGSGPLSGACSSYEYNFCHANICERHTSCTSCSEAKGCGWCTSSRQCLPGHASGPLSFRACPAEKWTGAWVKSC
eukprot:GEMP01095287.1.p1 GENE.GEMP01095287.1~~GEMP01095287.1.p1  ORF type:complete len:211 (+),score=35.05 GEMP01095287.1:106-738(+)